MVFSFRSHGGFKLSFDVGCGCYILCLTCAKEFVGNTHRCSWNGTFFVRSWKVRKKTFSRANEQKAIKINNFSGSFFGGFMIGEVGTRDAFRYMGLVAVAGGIAYKIMYHIWLKKFDAVSHNNLIIIFPSSALLQFFFIYFYYQRKYFFYFRAMMMPMSLKMERRKNCHPSQK